jgi:hypothetical protein
MLVRFQFLHLGGWLVAITALALVPFARADEKPAFQVPNRPDQSNSREREGKLKPGDVATDFTLNVMHSNRTVTLSSFKNQRPVVLVFGSYT